MRLNYLTTGLYRLNRNNQFFKAVLTTHGRKTGKDHSVWLRAVMYRDRIYFSRHLSDGDWFKNAIQNPDVKVEFNSSKFQGKASLVKNKTLAKKISQLKYPNQEKANETRVVLEVTLCEQL